MDIFRATAFRQLGGAAPQIFLHALEIDLGYLVHPQRGRGPPKKSLAAKIYILA